MTTRAGTSLIEMLAIVTLVIPIAGMSLGIATTIGRGQPADAGQVAALVCLQMRRDALSSPGSSPGSPPGSAARANVIAAADSLTLGGHRWQAVNGWWCRDAVPRLRIDQAAWTTTATLVSLTLTPHLLPTRTIELDVTP